jgi:hypothetical protein
MPSSMASRSSWSDLFPQFLQSTFKNWQSKFLQLIWQSHRTGAVLLLGSPHSRESGERIEAKIDALVRDRNLDPNSPSPPAGAG